MIISVHVFRICSHAPKDARKGISLHFVGRIVEGNATYSLDQSLLNLPVIWTILKLATNKQA